jgi:hypothetical protein
MNSATIALYRYSSARENVLEHLFIGELLRCLWCNGVYDAEILRSEVDDSGYDLVVECRGTLRYIQLKTSHREGRTSKQTINAKIEKKPNGCVVWIIFDARTLALGPFRWLGSDPGGPPIDLGTKLGKHTKGNAAGVKASKPNTRVVRKSSFIELSSIDDLVDRLFARWRMREMVR